VKNNKGFVFIETMIVTMVLITSLILIYSMFIKDTNKENRVIKYDDPAKVYQAYFLEKYLMSYNLKSKMDEMKEKNLLVVSVYKDYKGLFEPDTTDLEGVMQSDFEGESAFFKKVWSTYNINKIFIVDGYVSKVSSNCSNLTKYPELKIICSDKNMINYINTLDDYEECTDTLCKKRGNYFIVEFCESKNGKSCTATDKQYSFASVGIKEASNEKARNYCAS
jgi:competence protein ComGC